jgi:hypothetical protein
LQFITIKLLISNSSSNNNNKNLFTTLGQTETLEDDSLKFHTSFIVDYFFERNQILKCEILENNIPIGETISCTLGKVMGSRGHIVETPFIFKNTECKLVISGRQTKEDVSKKSVFFQINFYGKDLNDYFLLISSAQSNASEEFNITSDSKVQRIYKSNEISGGNIQWNLPGLNVNDLCDSDSNRDFIIEVCNKQGPIGIVKTTLDKVKQNPKQMLLNPKGTSIGSLEISCDIRLEVKFLDYIQQGLQISLLIGIDYTSSNGNPLEKSSLHYIHSVEPNQYEQAIRSCGGIVAYYDFDGLFPVYGFGGRLQSSTFVQHCFNVNISDDPNVEGVDGVIQTYHNSFNMIQLDGPTYFAPLLNGMVEKIKKEINNNQSSVYYVLLILTDGQIHDMEQTKDVLCEAAFLPFSVIIVGVGNADFSLMKELDGDELPLTNKKGVKIERDIVQFVCYNDFKSDITRLAEEVLFEVPGQIEKYFLKYKNFKPLYL